MSYRIVGGLTNSSPTAWRVMIENVDRNLENVATLKRNLENVENVDRNLEF